MPNSDLCSLREMYALSVLTDWMIYGFEDVEPLPGMRERIFAHVLGNALADQVNEKNLKERDPKF